MRFANPTPLRVGARGTLHGWTVTVAGRVVLGVEIEGERYSWNEFNLVDARGNSGTLVYEETEDGPQWKLFRLLTPPTPLSVAEARRKRVGDTLDFGGEAIPITLVDRSRVYHIEGRAPEGVEVGDLADFLNADGGEHMYVVSWTGNDVEYYEGRDVPAGKVAAAFRFSREIAKRFASRRESRGRRSSTARFESAASVADLKKLLVGIGIVVAVVVVPIVILENWKPDFWETKFNLAKPRVAQPQALRLANGATGTLAQRSYTVGAQAQVQVGRIAGRFERREYQLTAPASPGALLVNGLTGGTRQWHLLQPVKPPLQFTPHEAAARRKGNQLRLSDTTVTVTELFLTQTRQVDGDPGASLLPAGLQYGFLGSSGAESWLARWNERDLVLYRGRPLDEQDVLAALGPGPEKPK
ncbi:MAG: DUF4178 domain-containing protein [Verrucomicrobia bacterium]|nr:DUF4178 domain-containing protein [Verrucomicrobiota bacterium]